ncbi:MAG: ribonuclease HII [Thermoprotei archaeon]
MANDLRIIAIGLDEAGRGPLIGDLAVGLVAIQKGKLGILSIRGVRDSKELTPRQREALIKDIMRESVLVMTTYIPPRVIDKSRLNKLIASTMLDMLKTAFMFLSNMGYFFEVYVDEVKGFENYLLKELNMYRDLVIEYRMESNADKKYVVVSAASIIAKYYRDLNLEAIKMIYGDTGSGYPTDPKTREWLIETYKLYREPPPVLRRSWSTLLRLAPSWYYNPKKGRSILDYMGG